MQCDFSWAFGLMDLSGVHKEKEKKEEANALFKRQTKEIV